MHICPVQPVARFTNFKSYCDLTLGFAKVADDKVRAYRKLVKRSLVSFILAAMVNSSALRVDMCYCVATVWPTTMAVDSGLLID